MAAGGSSSQKPHLKQGLTKGQTEAQGGSRAVPSSDHQESLTLLLLPALLIHPSSIRVPPTAQYQAITLLPPN